MAKKTKINWGAVGTVLAVCGIVAAGAAFFFCQRWISNVDAARLGDASNIFNKNIYDDVQLSESGEWFLFPELKLRFPEAGLIDKELGERPEYYLSYLWKDLETGKKSWEIKLAYMERESGEFFESMFYAPVVVLYDPEEDYEVGDLHSNTGYSINGGEEKEMPQVVSAIVNLKNGDKLYVLTYDVDEYMDDAGEYRRKDLVEAAKKIELY